MAYLVLPGPLEVRIQTTAGRRVDVPVGEVRRAFSGKPRSSVSSYRTEWQGLETPWYTRAEAATLRAAMEAAPPIAITGDLAGSINVYFTNIREVDKGRYMAGGVATEHVRLGFDMLAA